MVGNPYIIPSKLLPNGFIYPGLYVGMAQANTFPDVYPWAFSGAVEGQCERIYAGLKESYPDRSLIPFAWLRFNDDIACFDGSDHSGDPLVYFVHLGTEPGWEHLGEIKNFEKWLEFAKGYMAAYMAELEDDE